MNTIPYLTAPKLADAVAMTLASDLITLGWLDYVYGISEIGEDDNGTYPIVYLQDGTWEYYALLPDDDVKAFSFFTLNGMTIGFEGELNQYSFSLYVWARLDNIQSTNNDYTMDLIGDVLIKLKDNDCFDISVETRRPFAEFTSLDPHNNSMIMRKRTGFRVDFSAYGDNNICLGIDTTGSDAY